MLPISPYVFPKENQEVIVDLPTNERGGRFKLVTTKIGDGDKANYHCYAIKQSWFDRLASVVFGFTGHIFGHRSPEIKPHKKDTGENNQFGEMEVRCLNASKETLIESVKRVFGDVISGNKKIEEFKMKKTLENESVYEDLSIEDLIGEGYSILDPVNKSTQSLGVSKF